jgi:hypothetical protein
MVGLNHEMSRELLWREYPSDLRATCFRRFWGGALEMPEIHTWGSETELGSHFGTGGGDGQLVLVIRGELLQRYPRSVIRTVRAVDRRTPGTDARHPLFRAALTPDTTCLGFDLDAAEARGVGATPAGSSYSNSRRASRGSGWTRRTPPVGLPTSSRPGTRWPGATWPRPMTHWMF